MMDLLKDSMARAVEKCYLATILAQTGGAPSDVSAASDEAIFAWRYSKWLLDGVIGTATAKGVAEYRGDMS